ncbi:hypothetical protein LCGC14_1027200 [marine sediment metagenome]|uniref:Uncharacterized protein n=1 Tax=marine sediment metagenome TaxID=412755 RepID=A0A0F9MVR5_9ZZZZ
MSKRPNLGFKESFEYILALLCYSYYVKGDNLVSDITFDELEKIYCVLTGEETAPMRAMERAEQYSKGVKFLYDEYKRRLKEKEINNDKD